MRATTARPDCCSCATRGSGDAASAPAEQLFDVCELQLDVGRAAVVALAAVRRCLHLTQQRVHLLRVEDAAGAHRAMAGQGAADLLQALRSEEHTSELQSLMRIS